MMALTKFLSGLRISLISLVITRHKYLMDIWRFLITIFRKGISAENLIKNNVGIFRFEEEIEKFRERFARKSAIIGWQGEVPYDPSLRGVMLYEL
jgi:hypothetical protein